MKTLNEYVAEFNNQMTLIEIRNKLIADASDNGDFVALMSLTQYNEYPISAKDLIDILPQFAILFEWDKSGWTIELNGEGQ